MEPEYGQAIELGKLESPRGPTWATLHPLGEAWVLWVRRDGSPRREHLGVLSPAAEGYAFVSRRGHRTDWDDWRELVIRIVARHHG